MCILTPILNMNSRQNRLLSAIGCLLLVISFFAIRSLRTDPADRAPSSAQQHQQGDSHGESLYGRTGNQRFLIRPGVREARKTSNFAQLEFGKPTALKGFPRGPNQRRRYAEPVARDLEELPSGAPVPSLALFPDDGRTTLVGEEIDNHTLKGVRLVFNNKAVEMVVDGSADRLTAPTPDGGELVLDFERVKTRSIQTHTLFGHVSGEELHSDVQLVYHDGVIFGTVARYNDAQHLEYRILADGYMMVRELDHSSMTAVCGNPEGPHAASDEHSCPSCDGHASDRPGGTLSEQLAEEGIEIAPAPQPGDALPETPGATTVDVVAGYGANARAADGGVAQIEARIITAIDRMNTAFANSLISNTEMMLLGTIEDPAYRFPGSVNNNMIEELENLENLNDNILDTVSDYATTLGADFQTMVVKEADGSAGIAFLPGRSSITARDYITSNRLTFAHELGHNLGCDHSWGDSNQDYHNRYGWRFDPDGNNFTTNDRVRTIMAYDWDWGTGQRVAYYANPDVRYGGTAPTGAVDGYDVTGDFYADQRYIKGGLGYFGYNPNRPGFDGTNASLGAQNYKIIRDGGGEYGAGFASNRLTRTAVGVPTPQLGAQYNTGQTLEVFFTGGDHEYVATLELYKSEALVATIASDLNPATDRNADWLIPPGTSPGNDYLVRVTLEHPTNPTVTGDSGFFTIGDADPRIQGHTPSPTPSPINLSEIVLIFSEAMDTSTFSVAGDIHSFTGPGGVNLLNTITGTTWSDNDSKLTISVTTQSDAGYYRMVVGPNIMDLEGNLIDQDLDTITGEPIEDQYVAVVGLNGAGPDVIWSDMVGTDAPDLGIGGWRFPVGGTWQAGLPAETPPLGPDAGADGGSILATNLSGSYRVDENSFAELPSLDLSASSGVSLRCKLWYGTALNDTLYIDCWNGSTWERIFTATGNQVDNNTDGWVTFSQDISSHADGNSNFRIRWGIQDISIDRTHKEGTGWQIDAVEILGATPTEPIPPPVVTNEFVSGSSEDPKSSLWIEFSNPMDQTTFNLDDDVNSFSGPSGSITPSGFEWVGDTTLRIDFPEQSVDGTYTLNLGPDIQDTLGNALNQDLDNTPGEPGEDSYDASFTIGEEGGTPNSIYITWSEGTFSRPFALTGPTENPDGDLMPNFMEFAFGADPTTAGWGSIVYVENGDVITPGGPIAQNTGSPASPSMRAVFGRRKDYVAAGLTYTVWFSANLTEWVSDATVPTVLTSDPSAGDIEAVSVPFPTTINPGSGEVTPQFFRVGVTMN